MGSHKYLYISILLYCYILYMRFCWGSKGKLMGESMGPVFSNPPIDLDSLPLPSPQNARAALTVAIAPTLYQHRRPMVSACRSPRPAMVLRVPVRRPGYAVRIIPDWTCTHAFEFLYDIGCTLSIMYVIRCPRCGTRKHVSLHCQCKLTCSACGA